MTNLNEVQERLLASVAEVNAQIKPDLDRITEAYELAIYRAKTPVRDAVQAAREGKVPMNRILRDGMGMSYPGQYRQWNEPPAALVQVTATPAAAPTVVVENDFAEAALGVNTVVRNSANGIITVNYAGQEYQIASMGSAEDIWSSADPAVPQVVYDLIQERFPAWELLEDED